jgi:hypothetical protein
VRVIGKRDYYDSALMYGHDPHTTFVRGNDTILRTQAERLGLQAAERFSLKSVNLKTILRYFHRNNEYISNGAGYTLTSLVVIACGIRYHGFRIRVSGGFGRDRRDEYHYFWSADSLIQWLAVEGLTIHAVVPWYERQKGAKWEAALRDYMEPRPVSDTVQALMIDRRWTILVYVDDPSHSGVEDDRTWSINQANLNGVEFYRAVPPNQMFQMIDQWVGGILPAVGREMVDIPDEIRAAKHGMDKTSFRRPKQK